MRDKSPGPPAGAAPAPAPRPEEFPALTGLPLAYGELPPEDARELLALKYFIEASGGFLCTGYKERCLRRRIGVRMRARGIHRYGEYEALLRRDAAEYQRLLDTVTINVSKFFRNPEVWRAIEELVVPTLLAPERKEARIWSAGCAGGEEPYTLAILLQEYAERHDLLRQLEGVRIHATDVDRASLEAARLGEFADFAFTEAPAGLRERWFDGAKRARLRAELRARVDFRALDLLRDPFPAGQHLIVCRNVIIYFERDVQEALFQKFHEALAPGGFLVLGKVETLFGPAATKFRCVAHRERIFRKA